MLALLRRSRALALVLVLLAPGVSGSAVQWLHVCPVNSADGAADHQHHGSSDSDSGQAPTCQCIGACNSAGIVSPVKPVTIAVQVGQPKFLVIQPSGINFVPAGTPSHLLPPATAPPLS